MKLEREIIAQSTMLEAEGANSSKKGLIFSGISGIQQMIDRANGQIKARFDSEDKKPTVETQEALASTVEALHKAAAKFEWAVSEALHKK